MICLEVIDSLPQENEELKSSPKSSWSELSDLKGKLQHSLNKGIRDLEGWGQRIASATKEKRKESFEIETRRSSTKGKARSDIELATGSCSLFPLNKEEELTKRSCSGSRSVYHFGERLCRDS